MSGEEACRKSTRRSQYACCYLRGRAPSRTNRRNWRRIHISASLSDRGDRKIYGIYCGEK
uniref:Uncharacterized protein n=1 Tax=Medicago truncatula TaxID=3880 RepID=I3T7C0_MEDTR|nr:unknown [Medicago truncatula]